MVAKSIMPEVVKPSGLILFRVLGACLLFVTTSLLFFKERIQKKDFWRIIVCAIFGVTLNQLLFFEGLSLTSPINASIIMTSNPILVLVLASIILKETMSAQKIAGVLLGCIGAILLITSSNGKTEGSSILGDVFILLNSISYGIYLVLVKPLMKKYKPITVITYVFCFGLIFVIPFGFNNMINAEWALMNWNVVTRILFVIIFTTFLAYLLNIYALKHVSPTVSSSYIYIQPIIAALTVVVFSWFAAEKDFSNSITLKKGLYAILIFVGVFLVSSKNYFRSKLN